MPNLILKNISQSYSIAGQQSHCLFKEISLELHANQIIGLIGPSGSGKSSLLNLCALIEQPKQGEIYFHNKNLLKQSVKQQTQFRRQHVGCIFQQFHLIPVMSVQDNVCLALQLLNLPKNEKNKRVAEMLEKVGLSEYANKKPNQLSGGQQQRVAIARALVKAPSIIIADEPTANLDSDNAHQIMQLIWQLIKEQQASCIMATHDQRLNNYFDKMYCIEQQRLIKQDNADESDAIYPSNANAATVLAEKNNQIGV